MTAEESKDLIVLDKINPIVVFSEEKGLNPIIEKIRQAVTSEAYDVTTPKGRARMRSMARKVGSSKQQLISMSKELTEDWRKQTKAVTLETSRMEKELDALRDEVKAPAEEFDKKEELRVGILQERLERMEMACVFGHPSTQPSQDDIKNHLTVLEEVYIFEWQEFKDKAEKEYNKQKDNLNIMLKNLIEYEKDQAELERLRKEKEERESFDALWNEAHDENNRLDDAAKKAREEAEAKAKLAQDILERKNKEAEDSRIASHDLALDRMSRAGKISEDCTSIAISGRQSELKAIYERDWQEFAEKADTIYKKYYANLGVLNKTAVLREEETNKKEDKRIADESAESERKRQKAADEKTRLETESREKDKEHRGKINREVRDDILVALPMELSKKDAEMIVIALASGKIRHTKINY